MYKVPLSMSLLGCGMWKILANFDVCGIMLWLRAVLNMLKGNPSPRGSMGFRCLMFSLSGPCELLFLFYCLLDLSYCKCNVISLYCLYCFAENTLMMFNRMRSELLLLVRAHNFVDILQD